MRMEDDDESGGDQILCKEDGAREIDLRGKGIDGK
jgi:hypothetical protein